jgi:hypothetical protein
MEKRHFSLEMREDNRLTKVFQIIFGILCIAIAVYWLIYNFKSVRSDGTLWITVLFLTGFGCYLVWSGVGYAYRFIEFGDDNIRIRKNSFIPVSDLNRTEIEKIVVFPLKVIIERKSKKSLLLRFGISDIEKIEKIKDEFGIFAATNGITFELSNEMDQ